MLNEKALLVAREALWVRRRERFKQLIDFKSLEPPTNNAMLEDARAAIEAYLAAPPDEDGLVKTLRDEAAIDDLPRLWPSELLRKAADALETPRAKPGVLDKQVAALAEFFNRCTESAWDGCNIDGSDVQEWGVDLGLLTKTQYDPEKHGPNSYDVEPGEDWYIFSDWLKAALAAAPEKSDD